MKKKSIVLVFFSCLIFQAANSQSILKKIDQNMSSKNRVMESSMTIHGKRISRTITSKTYAEGSQKSFSEYLSPIAEKGTKMLKLDNKLWIYTPSTDRIVQISGSMLRQSVMGSDLSYEDMMDDRTLEDIYTEKEVGTEVIDGRKTIILELSAKVSDVAYQKQKIWVDEERYVPLKQELYAKSGQLLKKIEFKNIKQVQGRWFPHNMLYKDMLKDGKGTEFFIMEIKFDVEIPDYMFSKASLKK